MRTLLHGLLGRQPRRRISRPGTRPPGRGRKLLPRLRPPLHRHPLGQLHSPRGHRHGRRIPRRDEDGRRPLHVDQDRTPLPGLLLARTARPILEGGLEPLGNQLYPRTDRLLVRRALRPGCPRGGAGVHCPGRPGQSLDPEREGRNRRGAPRRPGLRVDEGLPPHAAQGAAAEPPAGTLARPAARPLQRRSVASGP